MRKMPAPGPGKEAPDSAGSIHHDYGSFSRPKPAPLREILKTTSLEEFLIKDKADAEETENNLMWYHGKISREKAVHILRENGNTQGLFLIRESASSEVDYVVSIIHEGQPYHFQIYGHGDLFYQLSSTGPFFQGLDTLVNFFREGAHGIVTKFGTFCKGTAPPAKTLRSGRTTPLHRAVLDRDLKLVREILKSPLCSPVDARSAEGRTALHNAVCTGDVEIAETLIDGGANVDCKDSNCLTPLHAACILNRSHICNLLLQRGADPTLRLPKTGLVPLHEAAARGHSRCVEKLLKFGAPCHPRSANNETPLDLAKKYKHEATVKEIENHQPPCPRTIRGYWDHGTLDRNMATEVIKGHGSKDGQFLLRNFFGLSMAANGKIYHFEINKKNEHFFIDDGPYFDTLEHLIDYYMHYDDGFHVRLAHPIRPNSIPPKQLQEAKVCHHLPNGPTKKGERPQPPPRPPNLPRVPSVGTGGAPPSPSPLPISPGDSKSPVSEDEYIAMKPQEHFRFPKKSFQRNDNPASGAEVGALESTLSGGGRPLPVTRPGGNPASGAEVGALESTLSGGGRPLSVTTPGGFEQPASPEDEYLVMKPLHHYFSVKSVNPVSEQEVRAPDSILGEDQAENPSSPRPRRFSRLFTVTKMEEEQLAILTYHHQQIQQQEHKQQLQGEQQHQQIKKIIEDRTENEIQTINAEQSKTKKVASVFRKRDESPKQHYENVAIGDP